MSKKNSKIDIAIYCLIGLLMCALMLGTAHAATTNELGKVVLINDAGATRPANSIASPAQVSAVQESALTAYDIATNAAALSASAKAQSETCRNTTRLYSTNYMWQSRAYCEGVGAVNFDPSNQTMQVYYFIVTPTNMLLRGVAKQAPLVGAPILDFRATMGAGSVWTNLTTYSATEITIPAAYTNYAKAYEYIIAKPAGTSIYVRMRDSSSGMSGSGWAWLVYGDIIINKDGLYYKGKTDLVTNVWTVAGNTYTNVERHASGINVEIEPLGE
jgi:hypothetical protein